MGEGFEYITKGETETDGKEARERCPTPEDTGETQMTTPSLWGRKVGAEYSILVAAGGDSQRCPPSHAGNQCGHVLTTSTGTSPTRPAHPEALPKAAQRVCPHKASSQTHAVAVLIRPQNGRPPSVYPSMSRSANRGAPRPCGTIQQ